MRFTRLPLATLLFIGITFVSECNLRATGSAPVPHPYRLTVINGSGSDDHQKGDVVNIEAQAPADGEYTFAGWVLAAGDGKIDDPNTQKTTYTMGGSDARIVAVFARVKMWFPPGSEDSPKGLLLPKDKNPKPARLEQRLRLIVQRGSVKDVSDTQVKDMLKVKFSWKKPELLDFYDQKDGGNKIENDKNLKIDLFQRDEEEDNNYFEASLWYEGIWKQEDYPTPPDATTTATVIPTNSPPGKDVLAMLVPVDLDVVYPATGELSESREESEGGLVPIRVDDKSPVTKLRIHKCDGMPTAQFKLTFTGNKFKIWKNADRTGAVTSDSTPFPANVDTDLYLEGVTKSDSVKDIEVGLKLVIGAVEATPIKTKLTVIQAEFPVTVRAFIPYKWVNAPLSPQPNPPWVTTDVVAIGDSRTFDSSLAGTYRAQQKFTLIPYGDLSSTGIKQINGANDEVRGGDSVHYRKSTSVPQSEQQNGHGETLLPNPEVIAGPAQGQTGTHYVTLTQRYGPKKCIIKAETVAYEGILGPLAEPIQWVVNYGFDCTDPLNVSGLVDGNRRGFPAYEIYVLNSKGTNQALYQWPSLGQWTPFGDRGVSSLFSTEPIAPNGPIKTQIE